MAGIDARVRIGESDDYLEGVSVTTPAGADLFREGVVVSDPELAHARQRVTDEQPAPDDFGAVVRVAGPVVALTALVPTDYDKLDMSYTGNNLTGVVYSKGGIVVATLELEYTGDKLVSVARL